MEEPVKRAPRPLGGAGDIGVEGASHPVMRLGGVFGGGGVQPKRRRSPSASLSEMRMAEPNTGDRRGRSRPCSKRVPTMSTGLASGFGDLGFAW